MARVIIGVDPHKRSATIEVINEREQTLAQGRFGTDREVVPKFVELESGGPPLRACRVVGVGQPPSRFDDEEGDRCEQYLPEQDGRGEPDTGRARAGAGVVE